MYEEKEDSNCERLIKGKYKESHNDWSLLTYSYFSSYLIIGLRQLERWDFIELHRYTSQI